MNTKLTKVQLAISCELLSRKWIPNINFFVLMVYICTQNAQRYNLQLPIDTYLVSRKWMSDMCEMTWWSPLFKTEENQLVVPPQ